MQHKISMQRTCYVVLSQLPVLKVKNVIAEALLKIRAYDY